MNKIIKIVVVLMFFLTSFFCVQNNENNCLAVSKDCKFVNETDFLVQPSISWEPYKQKVQVKGVYMTGNTVGYKKRFNELINLIRDTELNAVVIDIKDDLGDITYDTNVDFARKIGANNNIKVKNFDENMKILRDNNIYPIARIVTFKDRIAANERPDFAIKSKHNKVWNDNKGNAWLNPYNKKSWEYPIQLAEEAALKGFKEIQFDYVRFPTDGKRDLINYGEMAEHKNMSQAISEFLDYAKNRLEPLGVYVSADVFGLVTTAKDDMNLGQHLETLATSVDILCPMVYPSHYALGSYGIKYPDEDPYSIVHKSLSTAQKRINNINAFEEKALIRPWLQDFSAPWLKKQYGSHYTPYTSKQIRAQIKACYDVGLEEWIFWNAGNVYTKDGYMREDNLKRRKLYK